MYIEERINGWLDERMIGKKFIAKSSQVIAKTYELSTMNYHL